jgi:hypothetical protein
MTTSQNRYSPPGLVFALSGIDCAGSGYPD